MPASWAMVRAYRKVAGRAEAMTPQCSLEGSGFDLSCGWGRIFFRRPKMKSVVWLATAVLAVALCPGVVRASGPIGVRSGARSAGDVGRVVTRGGAGCRGIDR
jgi:hypothetical protein